MSRGSVIPKRRVIKTGANLTPMIDIVFLLIIFFVLVSRISEVEQIPLELPEPVNPAAALPSDQARAVVNLPSNDQGMLLQFKLNASVFSPTSKGLTAFSHALAALLMLNPKLEVTLRADRRLPYSIVQETMTAVSAAGTEARIGDKVRMNLVIVTTSSKIREANDGSS
jgi:biopolymer transport protein ExbD